MRVCPAGNPVIVSAWGTWALREIKIKTGLYWKVVKLGIYYLIFKQNDYKFKDWFFIQNSNFGFLRKKYKLINIWRLHFCTFPLKKKKKCWNQSVASLASNFGYDFENLISRQWHLKF